MSPALPLSLSLITKIASLPVELDETHAPHLILGFVSGLQKEAGFSEGEAWGFVEYLAEVGGMPKVALSHGPLVDGLYNTMKDIPSAVHNVANLKEETAAGTQQGIERGVSSITPKIQGAAEETAGNIIPKIQGAAEETAGNIMHNAPGQLAHGVVDGAKNLWNQGKSWISNPENLKTVAPYAVAGIGSFLGAKALGAGTGAAALAGLAGGAAGGYGYNHWNEISNALHPQPVPMAPAVARPSGAEALGYKPLGQATSDNADQISKTLVPDQAHLTGQAIDDNRTLHGLPYQPVKPVFSEQVH